MAIDYEVQQGDCLSSIAFASGFTWETLWNHPLNAALKAQRGDPNVIFPGDVVHIPDLTVQQEARGTDQTHNFKVNKVPAKLRIQLLEEEKDEDEAALPSGNGISDYEDPDFDPDENQDKPRANVPYALVIDGQITQGQSDGDGVVEMVLSPGASDGRLILYPGTPKEESYPLQLGGLDPISEMGGIKKRLSNLGFPCGDSDDETPELEDALCLFQEKSGLPITGKVDDDIRQKLKEAHGG